MRLIVTHSLNVHFVDSEEAISAAFEFDNVLVRLDVRLPDSGSFAAVTCTGVYEFTKENASGQTCDQPPDIFSVIGSDQQFFLRPPLGRDVGAALGAALDHVDGVLADVGSLVRWRFNLSGKDSVLSLMRAEVVLDDGQIAKLHPIGQTAMGDDRSAVDAVGWSTLSHLLHAGTREPLGHQLLREAWNLRFASPRSSLIIGVTAAEVGLKQLMVDLVPTARSIVEEWPAPPLVKILKRSLPELPIRIDVEPDRRCPKHLHTVLDAAVQDRNLVTHRGSDPTIPLRQTLLTIREFLYLLDLYRGHEWAAAQLSERTRQALRVALP